MGIGGNLRFDMWECFIIYLNVVDFVVVVEWVLDSRLWDCLVIIVFEGVV